MPNSTTNFGWNLPLVNNATDADLWGGQLNSNWTSLDNTLFNISTIGQVVDFAGTSAPTLWLLCYGQAVSRTTYASLFSVISTTYGSGDGSTTFNLPDCRGRVSAGKDDMGGSSADRLTDQSGGVDGDTLGDTGGDEVHTLTVSEMPSHDHDIAVIQSQSGGSSDIFQEQSGSLSATDSTASTGGGGAHNNVQPTIIFNKIIYAGV
ncbi:MAG: putative tail collar protein [Prokaryotic dsDNA virus sp.]|nr:MAG: putative tail collar protein [Prokaryotic dsDNA virus sp.]